MMTMMTRRIETNTISGLTVAGIAFVLVTAGCQEADYSAGATPAEHAPDAQPQIVSDSASPISERDRLRQQEFEEAIRGIAFENGTIIVDAIGPPDPAAARAHFEEAETLLTTNQRTPAIRSYVLAVRSAPNDPGLFVGLGHAFIAKGKTDLAAAAYRTAAQLDDAATEPRAQLALTLAREGDNDGAIETMHSVLEIDPDHAIAHERLAIWNYYDGDYATAWRHVGHARRVGHQMPPQFIALLQEAQPEG